MEQESSPVTVRIFYISINKFIINSEKIHCTRSHSLDNQ